MDLRSLLIEERVIWGNTKQTLEHIVVCMGKTYGDIAKQARNKLEAGTIDESELKKELGNMVSSVTRWIDDLGFDADECVALALESQRSYQKAEKNE